MWYYSCLQILCDTKSINEKYRIETCTGVKSDINIECNYCYCVYQNNNQTGTVHRHRIISFTISKYSSLGVYQKARQLIYYLQIYITYIRSVWEYMYILFVAASYWRQWVDESNVLLRMHITAWIASPGSGPSNTCTEWSNSVNNSSRGRGGIYGKPRRGVLEYRWGVYIYSLVLS